jgi:hypothetical protein
MKAKELARLRVVLRAAMFNTVTADDLRSAGLDERYDRAILDHASHIKETAGGHATREAFAAIDDAVADLADEDLFVGNNDAAETDPRKLAESVRSW